eukprot:69009-Prymnesium_polylepis.1
MPRTAHLVHDAHCLRVGSAKGADALEAGAEGADLLIDEHVDLLQVRGRRHLDATAPLRAAHHLGAVVGHGLIGIPHNPAAPRRERCRVKAAAPPRVLSAVRGARAVG